MKLNPPVQGDIMKTICVLAAATILSACAWQGPSSPTAQNFGRAYEITKYNQILNPDAGQSGLSEGLGGRSTGNLVDAYETSFKEKKKEEVVNILKLQ